MYNKPCLAGKGQVGQHRLQISSESQLNPEMRAWLSLLHVFLYILPALRTKAEIFMEFAPVALGYANHIYFTTSTNSSMMCFNA